MPQVSADDTELSSEFPTGHRVDQGLPISVRSRGVDGKGPVLTRGYLLDTRWEDFIQSPLGFYL